VPFETDRQGECVPARAARRSVGTAVINDDDVVLDAAPAQGLVEALQEGTKPLFLVVGRKNHDHSSPQDPPGWDRLKMLSHDLPTTGYRAAWGRVAGASDGSSTRSTHRTGAQSPPSAFALFTRI